MKIKFIVYKNLQELETAQIFIYAEESEADYIFRSQRQRKMMFHHNPCTFSLREYTPLFLDHNKDFSLEFQIDMPFKKYCDTLRKSHFNNRNYFNKLTHNCSHAAKYALEQAGIKLPLRPFYRLNYMNSSSYFLVPGIILTPYQLFLELKKYKIQHLDPKVFITFEKQKELLLKQTPSTDPVNDDVRMITSELSKRIQINPHHAERYSQILCQTHDLIMRMMTHPNDNLVDKKTSYRLSANFFKNPLPRKTKKIFDYNTLFFVSAIFALLKYLNTQNKLSKVKAGLILFIGIAFISKIVNEYFNQKSKYTTMQADSNLYRAMKNLSI